MVKFSKMSFVIIVIALGFLYFVPHLFALQVNDITLTEEKSIPGSGSYSFKRLWEKTRETFTFSKKGKSEYNCKLLEKRLSELAALVERKTVNVIETAGQRYAAHAGKCNLEILKTKTDEHKKVLAILRDRFPANSTYWLVVQQDIDTLNILLDK